MVNVSNVMCGIPSYLNHLRKEHVTLDDLKNVRVLTNDRVIFCEEILLKKIFLKPEMGVNAILTMLMTALFTLN